MYRGRKSTGCGTWMVNGQWHLYIKTFKSLRMRDISFFSCVSNNFGVGQSPFLVWIDGFSGAIDPSFEFWTGNIRILIKAISISIFFRVVNIICSSTPSSFISLLGWFCCFFSISSLVFTKKEFQYCSSIGGGSNNCWSLVLDLISSKGNCSSINRTSRDVMSLPCSMS